MSEDYAKLRSEHFDKYTSKVAERLRRMADEVEREGVSRHGMLGTLSHISAAERVIHVVTWGVANLHLDTLVSIAQEADMAQSDSEVSS